MRLSATYGLAVFDCDGVILDSNRLKTAAFAKALDGFPKQSVDELLEYHLQHGGVSRFQKFAHFFSTIHPVAEPQRHAEAAAERFSLLVEAELVSCPLIEGVETALQSLSAMGTLCVVNSGGAEEQLNRVFQRRGLAASFAAILGSPSTKQQNMRRIQSLGLWRDPVVFFGDARSDLRAAQAFGCDFIFIAGKSDWAGEDELASVENFSDIEFTSE